MGHRAGQRASGARAVRAPHRRQRRHVTHTWHYNTHSRRRQRPPHCLSPRTRSRSPAMTRARPSARCTDSLQVKLPHQYLVFIVHHLRTVIVVSASRHRRQLAVDDGGLTYSLSDLCSVRRISGCTHTHVYDRLTCRAARRGVVARSRAEAETRRLFAEPDVCVRLKNTQRLDGDSIYDKIGLLQRDYLLQLPGVTRLESRRCLHRLSHRNRATRRCLPCFCKDTHMLSRHLYVISGASSPDEGDAPGLLFCSILQ